MKASYLLLVALLALASSRALAYDPAPLQDFCVAINDTNSSVLVNGKFCKNPQNVTAEDFFYTFQKANTSNSLGLSAVPVTVEELPGLNTLGVALVRIELAPKGLNPPHIHPHASEILVVIKGTLHVGFVTTNGGGDRLFTKVLHKGDVFVFPIGLLHFQLNVGKGSALAISGLGSQSPGVMSMANVVFGSHPPISTKILTKAFQVRKEVVDELKKGAQSLAT